MNCAASHMPLASLMVDEHVHAKAMVAIDYFYYVANESTRTR